MKQSFQQKYSTKHLGPEYIKKYDNNKKVDNPIKMEKYLNKHYIKDDTSWPIFM